MKEAEAIRKVAANFGTRLNDPEQTRASFVTTADAHDVDKSGVQRVWYRTGDLVRILEDGQQHQMGDVEN